MQGLTPDGDLHATPCDGQIGFSGGEQRLERVDAEPANPVGSDPASAAVTRA
jgi:hypothetical protein